MGKSVAKRSARRPRAIALEAEATPPALVNPKDLHGVKKAPIAYVPSAAVIHESMAFREGARKYDAYNWRTNRVVLMIYLSAALRHLYAFMDGEDYDPESRVHNLGCARACLGIILDGLHVGNILDDRPKPCATQTRALLELITGGGLQPGWSPNDGARLLEAMVPTGTPAIWVGLRQCPREIDCLKHEKHKGACLTGRNPIPTRRLREAALREVARERRDQARRARERPCHRHSHCSKERGHRGACLHPGLK